MQTYLAIPTSLAKPNARSKFLHISVCTCTNSKALTDRDGFVLEDPPRTSKGVSTHVSSDSLSWPSLPQKHSQQASLPWLCSLQHHSRSLGLRAGEFLRLFLLLHSLHLSFCISLRIWKKSFPFITTFTAPGKPPLVHITIIITRQLIHDLLLVIWCDPFQPLANMKEKYQTTCKLTTVSFSWRPLAYKI